MIRERIYVLRFVVEVAILAEKEQHLIAIQQRWSPSLEHEHQQEVYDLDDEQACALLGDRAVIRVCGILHISKN